MNPRLYNLAALFSLLVCVASLFFMVLSYQPSAQFDTLVDDRGPCGGLEMPPGGWEIKYADGRIDFLWNTMDVAWQMDLWQPALASLLFLFLWSGVPARLHLERR